jgi:ABC-type antimicrobial peptide transport system permease subunit
MHESDDLQTKKQTTFIQNTIYMVSAHKHMVPDNQKSFKKLQAIDVRKQKKTSHSKSNVFIIKVMFQPKIRCFVIVFNVLPHL